MLQLTKEMTGDRAHERQGALSRGSHHAEIELSNDAVAVADEMKHS
jgi:hypothetical protein